MPIRVPHISVLAGTNLILALTNWPKLTNTLGLTNGQLHLDGLTVTSPPVQFFRAAEKP